MTWTHTPVMKQEVLDYIYTGKGTYIDATLGLGGHSQSLLDTYPDISLIGIDQDAQALEQAKVRLHDYKNISYHHLAFSQLDTLQLKSPAKGILFDLGVSSMELDNAQRGFSFNKEGPLDMRMNPEEHTTTAGKIVNQYDQETLAYIFREHGDEAYPGRIARAICERRRKQPFYTTVDLAEVINQAVPSRAHKQSIHPATRVFQALRIEVNNELQELRQGLTKSLSLVESGGRIVVISFHSGEDRIVKNIFRDYASANRGRIITKKPLIPSEEECSHNPRSRSAKMRIFEVV